MSYNYQINCNNQIKKSDTTKHLYQNSESDTNTYIFELFLKDKSNKNKIFRCIKKTDKGTLISPDDNVPYNSVIKYKLSVLNINNPDKTIVVKDYLNPLLTTTTFLDKNIYLEISQNPDKLMIFNYRITF